MIAFELEVYEDVLRKLHQLACTDVSEDTQHTDASRNSHYFSNYVSKLSYCKRSSP